MLSDIQAIVLAAGKSTRLHSNTTTLREKICGQELIIYPLAVLHTFSIPITVVIGFQGTMIKNSIEHHYPTYVQFIEQKELTGTARAVQCTQAQWQSQYILIMHGNIPLITPTLIENLYTHHIATNAAISFIATHPQDITNHSYRYVIKKKVRIYIRTYEELTPKEQQDNCCITTGIYLISRSFLATYGFPTHHDEYDFVDIINKATDRGHTVSMLLAPFDHVRGVNTYQDIWAVEQIKRAALIRFWMDRGVRFSAAQNVHLDSDIHLGAGTVIGNGAHIIGGTTIGTNNTIGAFSIIDHATIGNNVTVHPHSIIHDSTIGDHTSIGPFAHIQSDTLTGTHCTLGNFVETKRTTLGHHSKAKHLTYLGDAHIGSHVNIGAGTITCNYNGKTKQVTHIKDHVFIGSNNSLVAPVIIEQEAFTAAGSVITENVPPHALAIGRARQVNKEGYVQPRELESSQEEKNDTKQSLSFIGATKSSFDL